MTSDPRIAALRASHDRLVAIADTLTPEQLRQRAYPAEWTIAQVLSHLGSGAEVGLLFLEAGLADAEAPSRDAFPAIWEQWNARSPEEQAADAIKFDTAHVEKIEENVGTSATFASWGGPTDLGGLTGMRLAEHAVHTWDIAVVLDPTATVLPDALPHILDLLGPLIGYVARKDAWSGLVRVVTTGPDREVALQLGESPSLRPWPADGTPAAMLALPAETFVRLLYGRLDPDHTPSGINASGVTLDDLRGVFRGL